VQRAFIRHRFEQYLGGAMTGLVIFSVVFGLGHLIQGRDAAIATGLLGAFWGIVYLRRRSIVAPVFCHALFNLTEVVIAYNAAG
jgi:membrane protease YdiL (CAAX protease family)